MFKPAEQTSEDGVIIAQRQKDGDESGQELSITAGETGADIRDAGGIAPATSPKRQSSTEKSLREVAEKATRAPRDG